MYGLAKRGTQLSTISSNSESLYENTQQVRDS